MKQHQQGFALLEAIVAITIMAAALVPIYGLISTSLNAARRLSDANLQSEANFTALEVMRAVNPMITPKGTIDLGLYRVEWVATPLTEPVDQMQYPRGLGLYKVALYSSDVKLVAPGEQVLSTFKLQQLGYFRVRNMQTPFSAPGQ
jgi:hypothetical protein